MKFVWKLNKAENSNRKVNTKENVEGLLDKLKKGKEKRESGYKKHELVTKEGHITMAVMSVLLMM